MTRPKIKFPFIFKIFAIFFLILFNSYADDSGKKNELIYIGSENASIKIKVYSSFTCPHCADFHENVLPEIKKKLHRHWFGSINIYGFSIRSSCF